MLYLRIWFRISSNFDEHTSITCFSINSINKDDINIDNFNLDYRSDKNERKVGRGICVLTKNDLCELKILYTITDNNGNEHVDIVVYQIFDVIIITGYSSPQTKFSTLQSILELQLQKHAYSKTIVQADFNMDNSKQNSLRDLMIYYNFKSALDESIVTTDYASQLDIIYINFEFFRSGVYDSYFSDHKPTFIEI